MLKIVGTQNGEVLDEKVILDDDNKITPFGIFLIGAELIVDVAVICLVVKIVKMFRK